VIGKPGVNQEAIELVIWALQRIRSLTLADCAWLVKNTFNDKFYKDDKELYRIPVHNGHAV
jgi:hypothetical protein